MRINASGGRAPARRLSSFTTEPSRRRHRPPSRDRTRSPPPYSRCRSRTRAARPRPAKHSAVRSLPDAELGTIARRFERELARAGEADLEDAARVPDPRRGPRELAPRRSPGAGAGASAPSRGRALVISSFTSSTPRSCQAKRRAWRGRPGEPLVAVVPGREAKAVGPRLEAHVVRARAPRDPEHRPELALALPVDLDGVVRVRRAAPARAAGRPS